MLVNCWKRFICFITLKIYYYENQITNKTNSSCLIISYRNFIISKFKSGIEWATFPHFKKSVLSFKKSSGWVKKTMKMGLYLFICLWTVSICIMQDTETRPTGCNGIKMHVPVVGRFNTVYKYSWLGEDLFLQIWKIQIPSSWQLSEAEVN